MIEFAYVNLELCMFAAESSVPPMLLEAILMTELPLDIAVANVSATADSPTLHSAIHDYLALQLEVC